MSNKNIISDTFNVSGKRLGDFFKWLEALDNATSFVATKCGSSIWYLQNGEISEGNGRRQQEDLQDDRAVFPGHQDQQVC